MREAVKNQHHPLYLEKREKKNDDESGCTWEANIEKYPNLQNKTLPWFVGCAKKANVIQTKMVFKCDPNRNGVPALWRVEYNLDGSAQLPEEGDELKAMFKIIEKHHPPNTAIVNVHQKHHPPNTAIVNVHRSTNAIIDYGVYCECDPLNFEETVQRPGQLPGATLLENVANMKIAEEEKACQD
ncbi:hypothetical protein QE152_g19523 [Popillia japonica]|uniref:Uncharacterized protein n=1 Tax=Popillia japonica TaxID=7064 RepID=A0AAW1KR98_POPJA